MGVEAEKHTTDAEDEKKKAEEARRKVEEAKKAEADAAKAAKKENKDNNKESKKSVRITIMGPVRVGAHMPASVSPGEAHRFDCHRTLRIIPCCTLTHGTPRLQRCLLKCYSLSPLELWAQEHY